MNNLSKCLGNNIRILRKLRGLTQQQLAEKVDIDPKYLSRIETGLSQPSLNTIENIIEVLNVSAVQIFDFSIYESQKDLLNEISEKLNNYSKDQLVLVKKIMDIIDIKK